jgi:hypothetical protein
MDESDAVDFTHMSSGTGKPESVSAVFPKLLAALEGELRLPRGILLDLLDQTDWELVIKAAVIAEVALGEAIQRLLTPAERERVIEKIDQGLGPKIRVARQFGLLTRDQCNYLREVAAMRNVCVHDREGLRFTFKSYLRDPANLTSFTNRLGRLVSRNEYAETRPSEAFVTPSAAVLGRVSQVCLVLLMTKPRTKPH